MFFGNMTADAEGFDMSNKEGRERALKRLEELLGSDSPGTRRAAKVLQGLFAVMDDIPEDFSLVHEVKQECEAMVKKIQERTDQLVGVAKLFEHGQPVHRMGMVDAYLTIAAGSLAAAGDLLGKLERVVARKSADKAEEGQRDEGPSGSSETPTDYPPPQPPVEAPLG